MNSLRFRMIGTVVAMMILLSTCSCIPQSGVPRSDAPASSQKLLMTMNGSVYSVNSDGSQFETLLRGEEVTSPSEIVKKTDYEAALYSPDRKSIVLELLTVEYDTTDKSSTGRTPKGYDFSLCLADASGKRVKRLTDIATFAARGEPPRGGIEYLLWAPTGEKIYYKTQSESGLIAVDMSGKKTKIDKGDDVVFTGNAAIDPTGNRIAYVEASLQHDVGMPMMIARLTSSLITAPKKVNIVSTPTGAFFDNTELAWLNKNEIACTVVPDATGENTGVMVYETTGIGLETINLDTGQTREIHSEPGGLTRLSASPDGKQLAFLVAGNPVILDIASGATKPLVLPKPKTKWQITDLSW